MSNQSEQSKQSSDDEIKDLLTNINVNCEKTLVEVQGLESKVTKQATIAGVLSGGTAGAVITVAFELMKAKFGG